MIEVWQGRPDAWLVAIRAAARRELLPVRAVRSVTTDAVGAEAEVRAIQRARCRHRRPDRGIPDVRGLVAASTVDVRMAELELVGDSGVIEGALVETHKIEFGAEMILVTLSAILSRHGRVISAARLNSGGDCIVTAEASLG